MCCSGLWTWRSSRYYPKLLAYRWCRQFIKLVLYWGDQILYYKTDFTQFYWQNKQKWKYDSQYFSWSRRLCTSGTKGYFACNGSMAQKIWWSSVFNTCMGKIRRRSNKNGGCARNNDVPNWRYSTRYSIYKVER